MSSILLSRSVSNRQQLATLEASSASWFNSCCNTAVPTPQSWCQFVLRSRDKQTCVSVELPPQAGYEECGAKLPMERTVQKGIIEQIYVWKGLPLTLIFQLVAGTNRINRAQQKFVEQTCNFISLCERNDTIIDHGRIEVTLHIMNEVFKAVQNIYHTNMDQSTLLYSKCCIRVSCLKEELNIYLKTTCIAVQRILYLIIPITLPLETGFRYYNFRQI